jgi:branched-chain amino acid transport system substrate-binding protein
VVGCSPSTTPGEPGPETAARAGGTAQIAYIADLSVDDDPARIAAASQGVELAVRDAQSDGAAVQVEVVEYDTEGDPARTAEIAGEIAAEPDVVAAVIGPFTVVPAEPAASLAGAGVPVVSLSAVGPSRATGEGPGWYRGVAVQELQARAIGAHIDALDTANGALCLAGDGTSISVGFLDRVSNATDAPDQAAFEIPPGSEPTSAQLHVIRRTGCVVVWGGFSETAVALADSIHSIGDTPMIGADTTKSQAFLLQAGVVADGTVVSCSCVDLTMSTSLRAQRFVNRFQFEFGSPPDAYAAEGYDAGAMILSAILGGDPTRAEVAGALSHAGPYEGLATTYRFGPDGELLPKAQVVQLSRARAGRWVPLRSA